MEYQETIIQITFRHPVSFTEVLTDDADSTEVALEVGLTPPLIDLYGGSGEVIIEKITADTSPTVYSYEEAARYRIH